MKSEYEEFKDWAKNQDQLNSNGGKGNMETLTVDKVGQSKFGYYLKSGTVFFGCTEQVANFLGKDFKGELNIVKIDNINGKNIATEVKKISTNPIAEARESKSIEMLTAYAKDIFLVAYEKAIQTGNKDFDPEATAKICARVITTIRNEIVNPSKEEAKAEEDNTI